MRKNWVTTFGGIMAAMGGIPVLVASSGATIPTWWAHCVFPLILIGIAGTALLGYAAKGADEHSTQAQVQVSTIENPGIQAQAVQEVKTAKIGEAKIGER